MDKYAEYPCVSQALVLVIRKTVRRGHQRHSTSSLSHPTGPKNVFSDFRERGQEALVH